MIAAERKCWKNQPHLVSWRNYTFLPAKISVVQGNSFPPYKFARLFVVRVAGERLRRVIPPALPWAFAAAAPGSRASLFFFFFTLSCSTLFRYEFTNEKWSGIEPIIPRGFRVLFARIHASKESDGLTHLPILTLLVVYVQFPPL